MNAKCAVACAALLACTPSWAAATVYTKATLEPDGQVVYDSPGGFVTEYYGPAAADGSIPGLDTAIIDARAGLLQYVNRRGEAPPHGLTRGGLSLWLLRKDDRTAMGIRVE